MEWNAEALLSAACLNALVFYTAARKGCALGPGPGDPGTGDAAAGKLSWGLGNLAVLA